MGSVTYPEVGRNFDQRITADEFLPVLGSKHSTGRQFTIPETLRMERSAVKSLRIGQDLADSIMQADAATRQANARPQLNDGQRKAIEQILTSRDRVQGLQGIAGTGKTTMLSAIREGAEASGYSVEGFAPIDVALVSPHSFVQTFKSSSFAESPWIPVTFGPISFTASSSRL